MPPGGPIRRYKCRSCGKEIVFNDEALTSSHEAPECEWFKDLVAKMGGGPGRVGFLGEDGREIKKS
jgi:hypothetical protein